MRVLISGSSGLVGSALSERLSGRGDEVVRLVRRSPTGDGEVSWDPDKGSIDASALEELDVVYHLAGESIASGS